MLFAKVDEVINGERYHGWILVGRFDHPSNVISVYSHYWFHNITEFKEFSLDDAPRDMWAHYMLGEHRRVCGTAMRYANAVRLVNNKEVMVYNCPFCGREKETCDGL